MGSLPEVPKPDMGTQVKRFQTLVIDPMVFDRPEPKKVPNLVSPTLRHDTLGNRGKV